MTTFSGFQTAASGLRAAQRGLDVTGQNLANATTPGYVRRRVDQYTVGTSAAVPSITMPPARGTGGVDTTVTRLADTVLDSSWRAEAGLNAAAQGSKSTFDALESVFDEPSDTGLAAKLDALWSGFNDLVNGGSGAGVLGAANSITDWLHDASTRLADQVSSARSSLADTAQQAQQLADDLAETNKAIIARRAAGQDSADLEDVRDTAADRLATLLGASTTLGPGGDAQVSVAGQPLVSGATSHTLALGADGVSLTLDGSPVVPVSGSASAAITTATVTVPAYQSKLDAVAVSLRDTVNTALGAGYTAAGNPGTSLFTGTGAADLQVAITDPTSIAGFTAAGSTDAGVAAALSQEGTKADSPDAQYRALVSGVGSDSARAGDLAATRAAATNSLQQSRTAAEGVSTDEETMNLLVYQRSYQAAARVMTTLDDVLDTLINHTGRAGL